MLQWVCWKTDTYFAKVDQNGTSQTCPNCGAHTGKKTLDVGFTIAVSVNILLAEM
ncbi:MAG: hypothetical protein QNJ53_16655 [Pleurocapsa sp. MO_192.B19]|nr:hypothetical protein [Pleurocapsa sp. MO_192.B19]